MHVPMLMVARRRRHILWPLLAAILFLSVRTAAALDVGTVVAAQGSAEIARDKARFAAALNTPISVGDELRTGSPGTADVAFFDRDVTTALVGEKAAAIVSSLTVGENSLAVVDRYEFDPRGPKARFLLVRGRASALVGETAAGYEIKTPTAIARATGTVFVVTYDPAAAVTEVVGVSGELRVAGLVGGEVWVSAREITTVAKGQPATPPRRLGEEQFRQYIEGLQFIGGGRPESLTVGSALREGTKVPAPDSFALGVEKEPNAFDPCGGLPSAPTCATGEPFSGLGGLDIEF
jgi:hypothetical protein